MEVAPVGLVLRGLSGRIRSYMSRALPGERGMDGMGTLVLKMTFKLWKLMLE